MKLRSVCLLGLFQIAFLNVHAQSLPPCGTDAIYIRDKSVAAKWLSGFNKTDAIRRNSLPATQSVITIPVVVHVVYNGTAENISDAQIFSQIDVLNEDFSRSNADTGNTRNI